MIGNGTRPSARSQALARGAVAAALAPAGLPPG
jgi:hypothetical protein